MKNSLFVGFKSAFRLLGPLCLLVVPGLLLGCSNLRPSDSGMAPEATDQLIQEDRGDLEAIGDIEVDRGLLAVEILLPAEFAEGITQQTLDSSLEESGFTSATLNADGTVTYVMTKTRHEQLLEELRDSVQESIDEFIAEEQNIYSDIKFDKGLRNFTVIVNGAEFDGESQWLEFFLAFQAGFFYVFEGTTAKESVLSVTYVDEKTGEMLAKSELPRN